ncbi:hypothetical protein M0804_013558 [Polistes exclamans]|nr:hypothetical protein M0804_013558 [Polistes exclamans]
MSAMGLSLGPNAHSFVSKEDAERISISDARAQGSTREGRMARRQQQLNILEANDEAEGSSYSAGIGDTINTNVRLVFYNLVKINSIFTKLKDKVDKLEQSNLVYKILCVCDKCYIGQTKKKIKKRLKQHKNDGKPANAQMSNTTALAKHHFITVHKFKFDERDIFDREDSWLPKEVEKILNLESGYGIPLRPKEVPVGTLIKDLE